LFFYRLYTDRRPSQRAPLANGKEPGYTYNKNNQHEENICHGKDKTRRKAKEDQTGKEHKHEAV
jgi:hypothetical protein